MTDEMTVIVRDNAGAFLTTMLQRVQAEVGESGGVRVTPNAKNTAFLVDVFEFSRPAKAPSKTMGTRGSLPFNPTNRRLQLSVFVESLGALGMSGVSNNCSNSLIC